MTNRGRFRSHHCVAPTMVTNVGPFRSQHEGGVRVTNIGLFRSPVTGVGLFRSHNGWVNSCVWVGLSSLRTPFGTRPSTIEAILCAVLGPGRAFGRMLAGILGDCQMGGGGALHIAVGPHLGTARQALWFSLSSGARSGFR